MIFEGSEIKVTAVIEQKPFLNSRSLRPSWLTYLKQNTVLESMRVFFI